MSIDTLTKAPTTIIYPSSDGQPMADNTKQFRWIVTIEGGLDALFANDSNVFVAGDLLWYPVEGRPDIRSAPDALVVFGRPKGDRGAYQQWREANIPPQVVFEVWPPGNRAGPLIEKFRFYERYGVEEYYIYDPDDGDSTAGCAPATNCCRLRACRGGSARAWAFASNCATSTWICTTRMGANSPPTSS